MQLRGLIQLIRNCEVCSISFSEHSTSNKMSDDPLAAALSKAKGISRRSASSSNRTTQFNDNARRNNVGRKSPKQDMSICSFCESEAAAICITKSLTNTKIPLCLVHYYTTRSCRIDPQKVSVIKEEEVKSQLTYVQDMFAEAFTELQKEIATESARSYNEMSKLKSDPLSILNDDKRKPRAKVPRGLPKNSKDGMASDGGFMRHVQRRETDLITEQKKRVTISNESAVGISQQHNSDNRPKKIESNPYKRRKLSSKSIWHLVLEGKTRPEPESPKQLDAFTNKCACGGNAVMFGNTTSRNNDVSKGDIWGTSRNDTSTRWQCQKCGKIWNELE